MGFAQDVQHVLDRHTPGQAMEHGSPEVAALVREVQTLRAEVMDAVDLLNDALEDLRRALERSG